MVKFVAKNLPVNNSDLYELDGYKPFSPTALSIGIESKYKNGVLTVKVTQDDALKYKMSEIETSRSGANKLFKGDSWEPKLFKGGDEIKGSTQGDILYGYDGNDQISGRAGADTIYGGKDNDKLYGGADGDLMYGGAGKDYLDGDTGVNSLIGGWERTSSLSAPRWSAATTARSRISWSERTKSNSTRTRSPASAEKARLPPANSFLRANTPGRQRASSTTTQPATSSIR
jgi:Ca2+-binding RTX toxin-like protein